MLSAPKLDKIEIAPRTLPGHKLCRSEAVKEFRQAVHGRPAAQGHLACMLSVLQLSEANQDESGATLDAGL